MTLVNVLAHFFRVRPKGRGIYPERLKIDESLELVKESAKKIRIHRNKRIAHIDLNSTVNKNQLPSVTFHEIEELIIRIEDHIHLVVSEFEDSGILFNLFSGIEITSVAEKTIQQALYYEKLEEEGRVEHNSWYWKNQE